jgi:hypothetical protein
MIWWVSPEWTEAGFRPTAPSADLAMPGLAGSKAAEWDRDYRYRLVQSLPQLIEKIRIFEDGLDDRIVEALKVKGPPEHVDRRMVIREDAWLWVEMEIAELWRHRIRTAQARPDRGWDELSRIGKALFWQYRGIETQDGRECLRFSLSMVVKEVEVLAAGVPLVLTARIPRADYETLATETWKRISINDRGEWTCVDCSYAEKEILC